MKKMLFSIFAVLLVNSLFALDLPWQRQKNAEEFINVETHFEFSDANGGNKKSIVYGSTEFGKGDYFIPSFRVRIPVLLNVQMHPTLLKNASGLLSTIPNSEKDRKREIKVEITITKSKNIQVLQNGGMKNITPQIALDGSVTYTFTIKNDSQMYPSIAFTFDPAEVGDAKITVQYYGDNPNQKIVDRTCDVLQAVKFTK